MPDDVIRRTLRELAGALTTKQLLFADTYLLNGLNAQAAARSAGYRNHTESGRLMDNEKVTAYLQARLEEAGFTPEAILRRLEYFAGGDMQDFLRVAPSERSYWIRADQHDELIEAAKRRGISVGAFDNFDICGILGQQNVAQTEDGVMMVCVRQVDAEVTIDWRAAQKAHALGRVKKLKVGRDGAVEFELHDPVKALELIGKHHKLFTEKVEHSGEIGVIGIDFIMPEGDS